MEEKNKFKTFFVFFIFALVIVGGFYLMKQSNESLNNVENVSEEDDYNDIRTNTSLDYIYYVEEETISEELDITYKEININFINSIQDSLNNEMRTLKSSVTYDKTNSDASYDGLTYAKYPIYEDYSYQNYLSLVVKYFTFDNVNLVKFDSSKCYVFDKNTGSLLTKEDLFKLFDLNEEKIKEKVIKYVQDTDLINGEETLDVNATTDSIDYNNLFVDKIGRLTISVLVKSSEKDYNENITLS